MNQLVTAAHLKHTHNEFQWQYFNGACGAPAAVLTSSTSPIHCVALVEAPLVNEQDLDGAFPGAAQPQPGGRAILQADAHLG